MVRSELETARLLIVQIEQMLEQPGVDAKKLLQARTLAAEASRSPAGTHRTELLRDARVLIKQASEGHKP